MANEKLDWDSEVEHDGQGGKFTLLPDGEYRFGVMEMAKTTSKKLQCPMAKLTIAIFALDDPDYKEELTRIEDNLVLHSTCEWKLCEFFRAIGDRKHGERIKPKWADVPGSSGRCRIKTETFTKRDNTEGKNNKVDFYLDPDAPAAAAPSETPPEPSKDKPEAKTGLAF